MLLGLLVFLLLSGAAIVAAASAGVRARWDNRAELATGIFIIAHAIISFSTLALGWLDLLYRPVLAAALLLVSGLTFAGSCWGRSPFSQLRETLDALKSVALLPVEAFRLAARKRHFALVALLLTTFAIGYSGFLSYLVPPAGWDGLWYHDTMVGYAIQNHGFRFVDVPWTLDYVNSFPRVCEMMNLWFVFFTDRRFIDMVGTVMSPALIAAFYAIARRYEPSRLGALLWALAFFWVPGIILQLNSTYIDTHIATIHLATLAIATRPKLRLRDGVVAGLAFGLLAGTKGHALTWIPFSGAVAFIRLFWQNFRASKGGTIAVALAGIASILFVALPTYARNWIRYKNPVYPVEFASETLHLRFPGHQRLDEIRRPFSRVLGDIYTFHTPGADHVDIGNHGYGYGLAWIAIPLAALALLVAIRRSVSARMADAPSADTDNLLITTIPVLLTAPLSPALWSARYNDHVSAAILLLALWATSSRGLKLFGDVPAGACLVMSFLFIHFAVPTAFNVNWADARRMLSESPVERVTEEWVGHWQLHDFAAHRENDLKRHDVVAYTDAYLFPALLWNERYENDILYVPYKSSEQFLQDLDDNHVRWVTTHAHRTGYQELSTSPVWEEMGPITKNSERWTWFRRRAAP
jgi:hypothetical protein